MYVCICSAVTDSEIREAVRGGACTLRDLKRELGVAGSCGRCAPCARELLQEERSSGAGRIQAAFGVQPATV